MKRYLINEVFYSLQGEGIRGGTANVFVRFSKCNLRCAVATEGFDCDTEFDTGSWYWADELIDEIGEVTDLECEWIIFTGGEPSLQLDEELIGLLKLAGWHLAIETNGTHILPAGLDWVCVSPKTADPVVTEADEVKFVLAAGAPLPVTMINADHYLLSPAFIGDQPDQEAIAWCVELCLRNPQWRLSCQQHKWWGVR